MYNITTSTAPKMPSLGKGTECIQILASQISPDMREAIVPMLFPALGAYISGTEFQYPDNTWKEPCGQMAHLIADSGMGKGQLTACIEAICRDFRAHDSGRKRRSRIVDIGSPLPSPYPRLTSSLPPPCRPRRSTEKVRRR